jgi:phospholipid-binding lipoprotein MlaA
MLRQTTLLPTVFTVLFGFLGCSAQVPEEPKQLRDGEELEVPEFERDASGLPRIDDPAEPFNRAMTYFNHGLILVVLDPTCHVWRAVTWPSLREATSRFFQNVRYPVRLVGNVLQAKWAGASDETKRFAINTTIGVLGFFDPAFERFGIASTDEDVGRAFSEWGWERSDYLVLPVFGPRTNRDALALPFNLALNPATYLWGAAAVDTVNDGTDKVEGYLRFVDTHYDPYHWGRYAYMIQREWQAVGYTFVPRRDRYVETLGATYLGFEDPDFPGASSERTILVPATGGELTYDLWLQDEPAPLVFVLPGLGGHRHSESPIGLAEMVHRAGYSAITISSTLNYEFMAAAASTAVPGFVPVDAADVHRVIGLVLRDLEQAFPGRVTKTGLLGMSLGGLQTLFIAAAADGSPEAPALDAYVAVHPPLRLEHGLAKLDEFYDVTKKLPAAERESWVDELIGKVLGVVARGESRRGALLPFDPMEAEFLIGVAFRVALREVIVASQDREDLGILTANHDGWRRAEAFDEAARYSFRRYMEVFALPYHRARDGSYATAKELLAACDAKRFESRLRDDPRVLVFTSANDFLLDGSDHAWLESTFGDDRLHVEPQGGHLGNLHEAEVQRRIVERLARLLGAPAN